MIELGRGSNIDKKSSVIFIFSKELITPHGGGVTLCVTGLANPGPRAIALGNWRFYCPVTSLGVATAITLALSDWGNLAL